MSTKDILENIIILSLKIDIILFERKNGTGKWILKELNIINNILSDKFNDMYNSFCMKMKSLLLSYKYDECNNETEKIINEMKIIEELKNLINNLPIINKKILNNDIDSNIIESFSNKYV